MNTGIRMIAAQSRQVMVRGVQVRAVGVMESRRRCVKKSMGVLVLIVRRVWRW